jgi:hypothetical protein
MIESLEKRGNIVLNAAATVAAFGLGGLAMVFCATDTSLRILQTLGRWAWVIFVILGDD